MGEGGSFYCLGDRTYWLPDDPSSEDLLDDLKIVKNDAGNPMSPEELRALQAEEDKDDETDTSCLSGGQLNHY